MVLRIRTLAYVCVCTTADGVLPYLRFTQWQAECLCTHTSIHCMLALRLAFPGCYRLLMYRAQTAREPTKNARQRSCAARCAQSCIGKRHGSAACAGLWVWMENCVVLYARMLGICHAWTRSAALAYPVRLSFVPCQGRSQRSTRQLTFIYAFFPSPIAAATVACSVL